MAVAALPAPVNIVLADYAIVPAAISVPAGPIAVSVTNRDRAPHDLGLVATALAADRLPTEGVRVNESDPRITVVTRTPRLRSGGSAVLKATVGAGSYVLVCTVPHHYVREQMVATLAVS